MNKSDEDIEMEFSQPVHAKVVFANFEIKVGDRTLISQVRTTKEAQTIYTDNIAAKKSAGIGGYVNKTQDFVTFYLGAIEPNIPIVVKSTFY